MIKVNDKARKIDADRLVSVSCIKEAEGFVIYYHFSKNNNPKMKELKIDVPAGEEVESLMPLYANAELFESEATELYGVRFKGNPSSGKRLFLEEK
jgi:NADH:ubiquinone oxidoreductase subunit C